jgi:predicted nucleotidyltransferase
MVTANTASRYFRPMAELLLLSFGPAQVVAEEFANVFGAERVVIFGSWARRLAGEAGPEPQDIDVLAVGDADRGSVYAAADRAQGRLHIDVNPVLRSVAQWDAASDALVASIKEGHHVTVKP